MPDVMVKNRLKKRLFPLYVAIFLQGFVLWYTVEKLFMRSIGFDDAGIGFMVALYSALMLVVETPSGILADRWSRKGVLILASLALAISSLFGGLSTSPGLYLVSACFWGIFWALYSGTYDSIVYDTLTEEMGDSTQYEHYFGRVMILDSVALVLGSLAGGVTGQLIGLQETYFLTVPLALASIFFLFRFKEPQLHKASTDSSLKDHVVNTFKAVLQKGAILPILLALIVITLIGQILYEFNQLWLIAIATPIVLFGPANALMLSTTGIGGFLTSKLKLEKKAVLSILLIVMTISVIGLTLFKTFPLIVACQVLLGIGLSIMSLVFTHFLHDSLPSTVRAGAASAVSTFSRILLIPCSLLFGWLSKEVDIFTANWLLISLLTVGIVFILRSLSIRHSVSPSSEDTSVSQSYQK